MSNLVVSEGSQGPLPFSLSWGVVGDVVSTVILLSTLDLNVRRSLMLPSILSSKGMVF